MQLLATACFAFLETLGTIPWWAYVLVILALLVLWAAVSPYSFFVRMPIFLLRKLFYRIRVHGLENVPMTGPALLVGNHVSHIDAGIVVATVKRPIRFLIYAPFMRVPILKHLLKFSRVIPIDSGSGPRAILQSLRAASEALKNGELVCIFAEGGITRTGFLLPFNRGFEQIIKKAPAPIIPVCLDQVWGSIFSYERGRFFWKWPRRIPYPVSVSFGKPMPPTATSFEVRQAIQILSAESARRRSDRRPLVHRQFIRAAARHPFYPCWVDALNDKKPIIKYYEALIGAKLLTAYLRPRLGEVRMVGVWMPPSVGGALANIALALLGKVSINLNYTASPQVVQSATQQCGIRQILTSRKFTDRVKLDAGPEVELIYLEDFRESVTPFQRICALLGVFLVPGMIQERLVPGLGKHMHTDLLTVIFSSGSTGEPKGVMLTHDNIASNAESMIQAIKMEPKDRLLGVLPFFHSFGYTVTMWAPLQLNASTVYYPDPRQAKEIGEICRKYAVTVVVLTPTFLRFCLRRCEPGDFATLRLLETGAEKLPMKLAVDFKEKFNVLPHEGYGCTELSPAAAANVPDFEMDNYRQIGNKPGTIGAPLPGVAARIVQPDTFEPLPPNQEGLLLICGPNVMLGYLGKPELTQQAIRDGWYVTGDIAKMDEDGFITITDRLSRFSKIGGEMVPHQKVEEELQHIVGLNDRIFVVTAVPDEAKGERLIVLHVPLDGQDVHGVWQQLNGKGLPNLWVPRERDFFQIDELPILGTGKLDLKRVKEIALERCKTQGA
jgi:acyl-[acyl-carrier-protein]-phospholipid O-acyltransferase / long-chain-fatty-acid--[acyl-carrier-protein] ligase